MRHKNDMAVNIVHPPNNRRRIGIASVDSTTLHWQLRKRLWSRRNSKGHRRQRLRTGERVCCYMRAESACFLPLLPPHSARPIISAAFPGRQDAVAQPISIFISAGEASGDLYGSLLIRAIAEKVPGARFYGCGGDKMRQAGCE